MGHRLTVTSDDGSAHVREVAEDVDREMRQLAAGQGSTTMVQLALITALNVASKYRKLAAAQDELQSVMDRLSQRVSETMNAARPTTEEQEVKPEGNAVAVVVSATGAYGDEGS